MSVAESVDDLVAEGLDFAIRIGEMPDSSIVTRKLAEIEVVLAVPTALLANRRSLSRLDDLDGLPLIGFRVPGTQKLYRWHFERESPPG